MYLYWLYYSNISGHEAIHIPVIAIVEYVVKSDNMKQMVFIHDKTIYVLLEERIKEKNPEQMISTSLSASL